MAEKRDLKRVRKRMTLKFGMDEPNRIAFTEDVSAQGMCIRTAFVCPPGTEIVIELCLPDGNQVRIKGVIAWAKKVPSNMVHLVKKCGMGVKFTKLEAGEDALTRLCSEISRH